MLGEGNGFCDAVLFVHAHRATAAGDNATLAAVAELAVAFAASKERHLETTAQGRAFLRDHPRGMAVRSDRAACS